MLEIGQGDGGELQPMLAQDGAWNQTNLGNVEVQDHLQDQGDNDTDQGGWDLTSQFFWPEDHHQHYQHPIEQRGKMGGESKLPIGEQFHYIGITLAGGSEEAVYLSQCNDDADAAGESRDDRGWYVVDQGSDAKRCGQEQDEAADHACKEYPLGPIGGCKPDEDRTHRTCRSGNLKGGSCKPADDQACNDRSNEP